MTRSCSESRSIFEIVGVYSFFDHRQMVGSVDRSCGSTIRFVILSYFDVRSLLRGLVYRAQHVDAQYVKCKPYHSMAAVAHNYRAQVLNLFFLFFNDFKNASL